MENLKSEVFECYGHYSANVKCRACQYADSCALYTRTEPGMERPAWGQDYDSISAWSGDVADYSHIPGSNAEENVSDTRPSILFDFAGFLNYLLHLDCYTLGVLAEIIAPSKLSAKRLTVAQIARIHGISRQGMHRKLLDVARERPELRSLLRCVVLKIRASKQDFYLRARKRKSVIAKLGQQPELPL